VSGFLTAPGAGGLVTSFADDFTRAAGQNYLGFDGSWFCPTGNNQNIATNQAIPFRVVGGVLITGENTDATQNNLGRVTSMIVAKFRPGGNQFAQVVATTIIDADSAGLGSGPVVLHTSTEGEGTLSSFGWQLAGYCMAITNAGAINLIRPQREDATAILDTAPGATVANGDLVRIEVTVGPASNLVEGKVNGVTEVSVVDADANRPTGLMGWPGMFCARWQAQNAPGTAAIQNWDDFACGLL